jgi:8-oxo-dGTP pyrophosphatase MutT (NUDIX family)
MGLADRNETENPEETGKYMGTGAVIVIYKRELILSVRSMNKKRWPGALDFTGSGASNRGETPYQTAVRETFEEIGLDISHLRIIFSLKMLPKYGFNSVGSTYFVILHDDLTDMSNNDISGFFRIDVNRVLNMDFTNINIKPDLRTLLQSYLFKKFIRSYFRVPKNRYVNLNINPPFNLPYGLSVFEGDEFNNVTNISVVLFNKQVYNRLDGLSNKDALVALNDATGKNFAQFIKSDMYYLYDFITLNGIAHFSLTSMTCNLQFKFNVKVGKYRFELTAGSNTGGGSIEMDFYPDPYASTCTIINDPWSAYPNTLYSQIGTVFDFSSTGYFEVTKSGILTFELDAGGTSTSGFVGIQRLSLFTVIESV